MKDSLMGILQQSDSTLAAESLQEWLKQSDGDQGLVSRVIGWSSSDMIDCYGHIGNRAISAFGSLGKRLT